MADTVFYAWQKDLPPRYVRNSIWSELERAIKQFNEDPASDVELEWDSASRDLAGADEIVEDILEKIKWAKIVGF